MRLFAHACVCVSMCRPKVKAGMACAGCKARETPDRYLCVEITCPRAATDAVVFAAGVGPKVAACVALFSLDKHAGIPVDTHVVRMPSRVQAAGQLACPKCSFQCVESLNLRPFLGPLTAGMPKIPLLLMPF